MKDFNFRTLTRVQYGIGISQTVASLARQLGGTKVMLLIDKFLLENEAAKKIIQSFDDAGMPYVMYTDIVPEPPAKDVDNVVAVMRESACDICVACGGGSTIDTAKAICMLQTNPGSIREYLFGGTRKPEKPGVPLICIPTTAGTGAEVSAAAVIDDTEQQKKLSVTDDMLIPPYALLDPTLLMSVPKHVAAATGIDALTHAIESYVGQGANPVGEAFDLYAMKLMAENIRKAVLTDDIEAKGCMLVAAYMAGVGILNCKVAVVHGIAQSIGALAHVPHGQANALILPHSLRKSYMGNPAKFKEIARILGEDVEGLSDLEAAAKAADAIDKLEDDLGMPRHLEEVGVTREMFPQLIADTMKYRLLSNSPVEVDEKYVEEVLNEAF